MAIPDLIAETIAQHIISPKVISYAPTKLNEVTGRFVSANRVYNFVLNKTGVSYSPAGQNDSLLFSALYLRQDTVRRPKIGNDKCNAGKSYQCGKICLGNRRKCHKGIRDVNDARRVASILASTNEKLKTDIIDQVSFNALTKGHRLNKMKAKASNLMATTGRTFKDGKLEGKKIVAKPIELKSPPENSKTLGAGQFGEVYLTPNNTAYKKAKNFVDDKGEYEEDPQISQAEIKLLTEASNLGVSPKLLGVYSEKGKVKGYEMEFLGTHDTLYNALREDDLAEDRGSKLTKKELERNKQVQVRKVELAENIALTASKLHKEGILHLDLHSGNICVKGLSDIKFIDYGLSAKINAKDPSFEEMQRWAREVSQVNTLLKSNLRVNADDAGKATSLYLEAYKSTPLLPSSGYLTYSEARNKQLKDAYTEFMKEIKSL